MSLFYYLLAVVVRTTYSDNYTTYDYVSILLKYLLLTYLHTYLLLTYLLIYLLTYLLKYLLKEE